MEKLNEILTMTILLVNVEFVNGVAKLCLRSAKISQILN